jgi:ribosomal protein S18 acetylase RimI-like enzyme
LRIEPPDLGLRLAAADDEPFLFELYTENRRAELQAAGLDEATLDVLVAMQYRARQQQYESNYSGAEDWLALVHHEPVGRCLVFKRSRVWTFVDLAVLPSNQGCGIATEVMRRQLSGADREGAVARLHVGIENVRAQRLYRGLGFDVKANDGVYLEMERALEADSTAGAL